MANQNRCFLIKSPFVFGKYKPALKALKWRTMKTLVTYSSLTGNTQKIAEAVSQAIEHSVLLPLTDNPDSQNYDLIIAGFWVDKGLPDARTKSFLEKLSGQKVGYFFTLGAYPDSDHAQEVSQAAAEILAKGQNIILGSYRCQGKVDPVLLEKMKKMLPPDHPHAQMTPERKARLEEAAKHPDNSDLQKARAFALEVWQKAQNQAGA
jgi:flavodoxin